jgi:hypothetical protein
VWINEDFTVNQPSHPLLFLPDGEPKFVLNLVDAFRPHVHMGFPIGFLQEFRSAERRLDLSLPALVEYIEQLPIKLTALRPV